MTTRKLVNLEVTDKGAVYIDNTRITGRHTKWGTHRTVFTANVFSDEVSATLKTNGYAHILLDKDYAYYASEIGVS